MLFRSVTWGTAFTAPTATTNSTAAVAYTSSNTAVATVNATTGAVTIVGVGTTTITASVPAAANYTAATPVSYQLVVIAGSQVLSWDAATNGISSQAFGNSFSIGATSSAALTPTYAVSGGCTLAGTTVTMTSGTTSCVITADQAGSATTTAAPQISKTVAAALAVQNPLLLSATTTSLTYNPSTPASTALQISGGSGTGAVTVGVGRGIRPLRRFGWPGPADDANDGVRVQRDHPKCRISHRWRGRNQGTVRAPHNLDTLPLPHGWMLHARERTDRDRRPGSWPGLAKRGRLVPHSRFVDSQLPFFLPHPKIGRAHV